MGTKAKHPCPACRHPVDAWADRCPSCGHILERPGIPSDIRGSVQKSLRWLNSLWKGYQEELDRLDGRIKQALSRVEALRGSKDPAEEGERRKLELWLQQAMEERSELERLSTEAGDALLTFSRLWSLPEVTLLGRNDDNKLQERMMVLQEKKESLEKDSQRMEEWWEAHRRIQRDLFSIAIGKDLEDGTGTRRELDELRPLLQDLLERLRVLAREEAGPPLEEEVVQLLQRIVDSAQPLLGDRVEDGP